MLYIKFTEALFGLILIFNNVAHAELLGSREKKSRNIDNFPKWVNMLERFQEEESLCAKNNDCRLNKIANEIKKSSTDSKLEIIRKVNNYVNNIKYVKDSDGWNISDYWATPAQFFEKGGDCEDYAIAKLSILKKMGFKNKEMRVVVLKDIYKNIIHSILVVKINKQQYILDNNIPKVINANEIRHYKPIFSINEKNWWKHKV